MVLAVLLYHVKHLQGTWKCDSKQVMGASIPLLKHELLNVPLLSNPGGKGWGGAGKVLAGVGGRRVLLKSVRTEGFCPQL